MIDHSRRAFADVVAAACQLPMKRMQPPPSFYEKPSGQRAAANILRADILRAKRYVIEDDVTEAAVDLGMQHPDILLAALKNAMAPFDTMWIEWNPMAQYRAAMENSGLPSNYWKSDHPPASNVGVLLKRINETGYRIFTVGECLIDTGDGAVDETYPQIGLSPLSVYYDIHTPVHNGTLNYAEEMVVRHSSWTPELVRAALLAGAYVERQPTEAALAEMREEGLDEQQIQHRLAEIARTRIRQCDQLSSHAMWVFDPVFGAPFKKRIEDGPSIFPKDPIRDAYYKHAIYSLGLQVQEEAGNFRFVISVLALLVGRDRLVSEIIPTRMKNTSKFHKGRVVPFLENRRVSLTVPRKIANRRIVRSLSKMMPRAQHDVEGHWKQRRKGFDTSCDHVLVSETPRREVCAIQGCGFKRWHVDEFKRGDPSVGIIKKTIVAKLDRG